MKAFKIVLISLSLTVLSITLHAQPKPYKAKAAQTVALKKQANEMAAAMMKQDYQKMAYYTVPRIVTMAGGKEKMAEKIKQGMMEMQARGVIFKSVSVGDIKDIYKSKGDLYSLVPDIIQLSANGTVITRGAYLLAVSHNNGLRWFFTDTAPFKNQNLKKMFPTYPDGLVIPETGSGVGM
ncbi:hypothetical protein BEL04_00470 [Mucilaginibacter sp. PPCGB 2223]|uniref:hypothetical protein n=1 Tax=Mucilaginibacter sp. PPCGB 2223 TaxID=1886027 RepID=UPI0008243545|nr:hypothetical protein [Mucilaginibacter sp. PPCGB 2223]OCX52840.1 hypothetical protein BEL04_00470 [Mucilaginibacter sp. PPCGB 2223]